MEAAFLMVITTTDSVEDANRIADAVVKKRLVACAQVEGPMISTYWWEGKVEQGQEWKCSMKTSTALYSDLEAELTRVHTYDTPEIIAIPIVQGSREYLAWMADELEPLERL